MKEIYADYFMQIMDKEAEFKIDNTVNQEILREIALEGKIAKMEEKQMKQIKNKHQENEKGITIITLLSFFKNNK